MTPHAGSASVATAGASSNERAKLLAQAQSTVTRANVWRLAAVPFAVGAGLRLLVVVYVQALHGNFLFLDDQGYDRIGWSLAQAWHMHAFPWPGSVDYAGTLSYLHYVFVAAVYFVFGRHWVLVKLISALLSALSVPAAAAVGDSLSGRRLGVAAAWLTALYPNAVLWGVTGLKDGPLTTLLLVMAAIALRPLTVRRTTAAVALISAAFLSRPVEGVIGLAMLVVPAIESMQGRWPCRGRPVRAGSRLLVTLVGLPTLAVVSVFLAARYLPTLKASLAGGGTLSLDTGPVAIGFTPSPFNVLRALLGPFPWSFGPASDTVYRALYPGTAIWIVMLPAVALGCWELLRRGPWAARGVVVSALAYLYLYACVFQSQGFFRQRYTVEILLLVVGLYAFKRLPRWTTVWTALGVCVVAPAALVQAGVLPPTGLALMVIALGAVWLAEDPAALARVRRAKRRGEGLRMHWAGPGRTDGVTDEDLALNSALVRATSTGMHAMGLRISGYGVGFVASILIARALGPAGRGLYAYPVALLGIVMALAHVGLEFAQIHLVGQGRDPRRMWANATAFSAVAGVMSWACIAGVLAIDPRAAGSLPLAWIAVPIGLVPLLLMSLYWASLLQLEGRLMTAAWASWCGVALQAVATGALFALHELTPFRVLLLQWLTNGSAWLLLLLACRRAGLVNLRIDRVLLRRSVAFGVKAYVAQVFFFLVLRVDQVLVRGYGGYRQLGLYALATTAAELLWVLTDPLAAALIPHQARARTGEDRRLSFAMARLSLWISMAAAVGGWVLAPIAIRIVYGPTFAGAASAVRLLLPGVVALAATRPLRAMLVKEGRAAILSALGVGALGLNIALNLLLLPRIGIRGASIASSVCYAALALSYVAIARRRRVAGWRDAVPRPSDLRLLGGRLRSRADRRAGLLRVAFVVGTLNRGGTERQIIVLGSALVARGHPVTVICLDSSAGQLGAAARAAGIRVVEVGFRGLQRSALLNPFLAIRQFFPVIRRFRRLLRDTSPDVVHCFLPWAHLLGVPTARSARVPLVVSSRRSLAAACRRPRVLAPWERVCDRLADAVVCNSSAVMEDAIRHTGLPRRKAVVIRNGVSLPPDVAAPIMPRQRIVIVANLIAYKGHAVALTAFARVRAVLPTVEPRLQLAGSGPEEAWLRGRARELGIDGDVEFLGSVADVPALLACCSFTVLPSLSEGMPNAVLESLAHGRAVVASAVGGVPEILNKGGGFLVPPGDPDALADVMCTLLADPARAARLGAEGRILVRDWFGADRMVDESLRLYEGLLAGRTPGEACAEESRARFRPGQPVRAEGSLSDSRARLRLGPMSAGTGPTIPWRHGRGWRRPGSLMTSAATWTGQASSGHRMPCREYTPRRALRA
jgi:glycosyltransferase involved in cell wall biosynthesis/O-antigen/teichoic acid export membrane protein